MRVLDGALGTETLAQLLVRDNALVFSMEHVRLIIMCDKVGDGMRGAGQGRVREQCAACGRGNACLGETTKA